MEYEFSRLLYSVGEPPTESGPVARATTFLRCSATQLVALHAEEQVARTRQGDRVGAGASVDGGPVSKSCRSRLQYSWAGPGNDRRGGRNHLNQHGSATRGAVFDEEEIFLRGRRGESGKWGESKVWGEPPRHVNATGGVYREAPAGIQRAGYAQARYRPD